MNSDITKCSGDGCPWKLKCHRFLAPANQFRQSFFSEIPGKPVEELFSCSMFWGIEQDRIYNQLKSIMSGKTESDEN
jgi:hypothetical protein